MATSILITIASWIIGIITVLNYGGVALLMAIESMNIPLPSEVIMPFAGYLVARGEMNLWLVALAGAVGCVLGSALSYWIGAAGGRPLIEKYGKYILISHHDLDTADIWFQKYGEWAVLVGRLLPVVRTFISFPAGIAKMNFRRFILFSFIGSLPWCLFLAYIGEKLGQNWGSLKTYFHGFDTAILALIILGIVWYVWRHIKNLQK
jgi:membrane protein DedA with SNARE-associated domain